MSKGKFPASRKKGPVTYTVLDPADERHACGLTALEAAERALTQRDLNYEIRPSEAGWRLWYGPRGRSPERTVIQSRKLDIVDARREILEAVASEGFDGLDVEILTDRAAQDVFTGWRGDG